jgi:hypothetical protein
VVLSSGVLGYGFVNSMQIENGNEWDIRQGKGGFLLLTACKLKLELCGISDRGKGYGFVNSMQIETGTEWDIRKGERWFCVVNSVQIETGTKWDIRQGKGGILLSSA